MRNHRKVKALRNRFGQVLGYAFWAMFLEYLTEADGNEIEYTDTELELFAGELGISATEIREIVEYCIKMEMLFLSDGFIHSQSLDEDLSHVYDKRKKAKELSATRKRRSGKFYRNTEQLDIVSTEIPNDLVKPEVSATEKPHIRKDNKEINKENEEIFDSFRKQYPGVKRGNKTEFEYFKKKTKDWQQILPTLSEVLGRQIELRNKSKDWKPEWKHLKTWISNRCWEETQVAENLNGSGKHTEYETTAGKFFGIG